MLSSHSGLAEAGPGALTGARLLVASQAHCEVSSWEMILHSCLSRDQIACQCSTLGYGSLALWEAKSPLWLSFWGSSAGQAQEFL